MILLISFVVDDEFFYGIRVSFIYDKFNSHTCFTSPNLSCLCDKLENSSYVVNKRVTSMNLTSKKEEILHVLITNWTISYIIV